MARKRRPGRGEWIARRAAARRTTEHATKAARRWEADTPAPSAPTTATEPKPTAPHPTLRLVERETPLPEARPITNGDPPLSSGKLVGSILMLMIAIVFIVAIVWVAEKIFW